MPELHLAVESEARPRVDVLAWALRLSLAFFFLDQGAAKFSNSPGSPWIPLFAQIGLGQWLRIATGWLEVGGAAMLVVPRLTPLAVLALGGTMIGAMLDHIVIRHDPGSSLIPLVFLIGVTVIGSRYRSDRSRRRAARREGTLSA